MSELRKLALFAAALASLAGCPPGGTTGTPTTPSGRCPAATGGLTGTAASALTGGPTCPDFGCGANSPTVADGVVFDELDAAGAPGGHGIRIVEAHQLGKPVRLHVERHLLSAVATDGSGEVFARPGDLIGTVITLDKGGVRYQLMIAAVEEQALQFWAGDTESVPFYKLVIQVPGTNRWEPICRQNIAASEQIWAPVEHHALAFAGDRYDAKRKTVMDAESGTTWFNLACAGSATAKLHLMRHTNAGAWTEASWRPGIDLADGSAPFHTSVAQRQAMLKMFAADYCGTGEAFTVDGQPLRYGDAARWYPGTPMVVAGGTLSPAGTTMEALWTEHGAACLDTPRLIARSEIPCLAALPACTPEMLERWTARYHVISANPPCSAR